MIVPGILEKDFEEIKSKLFLMHDIAERIQVDVADGKFVQATTFTDVEKLGELKLHCELELHLMVKNPGEFVKEKIKNVSSVVAHIETGTEEVNTFIEHSKGIGYKVGISLNPETDISTIALIAHKLDFVQFMTVQPGKQGEEFLSDALEKIRKFRKEYPSLKCQVDGGINMRTLDSAIESGAQSFVVGTAIYGNQNPHMAFAELKHALQTTLSTTPTIKKIAFLGGAAWEEDEQAYQEAFEVAKLLTENGYDVVNGGGPGVMRASTKGAHAGKGEAMAVTYYPNKPKRHYEGVDPQNDFDEEVRTLDYFDRTKVMLQGTDMHIVFNGSIGTLSELGMTWVSSWIHEPNNKPIVLYGDFWKHYIDYVKKHMYLKSGEEHLLKVCTKPEEVLEYIKGLEKKNSVSTIS